LFFPYFSPAFFENYDFSWENIQLVEEMTEVFVGIKKNSMKRTVELLMESNLATECDVKLF